MNFKAALVNNINAKPFVPANPPPRYPAHLSVLRVQGEDGKPHGDTPARRRRRRRHNAAKRQELTASYGGQDQPSSPLVERPSRSLAIKPIIPSVSLASLPTPPESRIHTPLRAEFNIPQSVEPVEEEEKPAVKSTESDGDVVEPSVTQQDQVEDVPVFRLLQATPVHPPFPYSDAQDRIPIATLQAIASRAQARLTNRIQAYQEEQQNVVSAATRIQEAYSGYIGERLEGLMAEMKSHLNAELEKRFAAYEQHRSEEFEAIRAEMNQTRAPPVGGGLEGEALLAILQQLHLHSEQIQTIFVGLKQTQMECMQAFGETRAVMEGFGLLPPTPPLGVEQRRMPPVPVFGNRSAGMNGVLDNASINASTPSAAPKISAPVFIPKQVKVDGSIRKPAYSPVHADVGKENALKPSENDVHPRVWAQEARL